MDMKKARQKRLLNLSVFVLLPCILIAAAIVSEYIDSAEDKAFHDKEKVLQAKLAPIYREIQKIKKDSHEITSHKFIQDPYIEVIKSTYEEEYQSFKTGLYVATDPNELVQCYPKVKTIIYIDQDRECVGSYYERDTVAQQEMGTAFKIHWSVKVVLKDTKEVIASSQFVGGDPPNEVTGGGGDHYGSFPDIKSWLISLKQNEK